ncbi:putative hydroxyphenylpyruvate reductase [Helianthus anomalus]
MSSHLEQQLQNRFTLFRLWNLPNITHFFNHNAHNIQAVVGSTHIGADAELIDSLSALEIVLSFSVRLHKVDLAYCKEKVIRVTNTLDVLTDDVADTAIGLILATLKRVCEGDRFV